MEFGILIDRMIDPHQQALGLEVGDVRLQVEPRLIAESAVFRRCRNIIHRANPALLANPVELSHGSLGCSSSPDKAPSPSRGLMAAHWRPPRSASAAPRQ